MRTDLQPWQLYTIYAVIGIVALFTLGIVAREIWYAVNPDKRPLKKRRPDLK